MAKFPNDVPRTAANQRAWAKWLDGMGPRPGFAKNSSAPAKKKITDSNPNFLPTKAQAAKYAATKSAAGSKTSTPAKKTRTVSAKRTGGAFKRANNKKG